MSSVPSQERPEQPSTVTGSTAAQQPSVTPVEERPGPSAAVVPAPHQAVPETVIQMQTEEHGEHTPLLRGISRRTSLPELLIQGAQKRLRQISPPSRIQVGMELARAEAASGRPRPASVAVAAEASPIRTSATDSAAMTPDIPYIAPAGDGAPEAGGRRASIYEYIEYILTELAHPFDPKVPPVDVAARDQAEALKTIVNHIVADFQANKITVDRKAIRRIITRLVYSRISLPVLCAAFFRNSDNISWDVADNVITPLLQLTDASPTATTYTVPDDTQGFYLRSKSLSVTDAWLLIERFQKRFHHEVFVDKMIEMVKSARLQGKAIVHLRYIGMFETPASTPAVRLHQDLATTAALFAKVELCLQELAAADELDNNPQWAVYEFKSVRIPAQSSTDPLEGDLVERTLIALFGYDNLVNVQHGGFFASYAPSMADRQLFQGLNTSFGQTFAATAMVGRLTGNQFLFEGYPQTVYTAQVVAHFNNVSTFIRNNPSTLANMDYGERWNQFLIKSTIYQAIPGTLTVTDGSTLVVAIGKDLPIESTTLRGDARFFFGQSRAGALTRSLLTDLLQWEGLSASTAQLVLDLIPFVDLCPWLVLALLLNAEDFLSAYLRITRPWITITFSALVSRTLANGFQFFGNLTGQGRASDGNGDRSAGTTGGSSSTGTAGVSQVFLELVGTIHVASFDKRWLNDPSAEEAPDNSYTVVICHYHPGRNKYGAQHDTLRRVFLLTWMATFVLLEEARLALQGMGMGSRSRKATCLEIKGRTEARLQATGFTTAFTTAKAELSRYLTAHGTARAAKGAPLSEEVKAIRHARFANTRLLQFANLIAIGDPGSSERRTQLERLYKSRRPELGVHINFSNREQWFNWMDSRTRGVSYVTSIISAVTSTFSAGERGIYIRSLGLPINATQAQIEEASRQRQAQLRASRAASASFRAAQQTRALTSHGRNADSVLSAANLPLEGQEVTRHEGSGTFSFFGTVNDKPVRIVVNASSTILKRNPRLSFRDDGLALTAEDGADLGVIVSSATMPFLKTHGHNLFTVWKAEVERRIGRPLAPHETGQLPAPAGQDPNLPAWAARRKLYKIKPVRQDGALWLFRQWLDEEFPDAVNEIRHHWEDASLPFTTRFPTWITEHYPDHPWAAWWRAYMLDPPHTRKKTDTVRGCVVALRGEVTSNKQYLVSAGVSGKVWVFGPPRDDEDLE